MAPTVGPIIDQKFGSAELRITTSSAKKHWQEEAEAEFKPRCISGDSDMKSTSSGTDTHTSSRKMKYSAKKVRGIEDKRSKISQWMQDHKKEANDYKHRIQELANREDEVTEKERQDVVQMVRKICQKITHLKTLLFSSNIGSVKFAETAIKTWNSGKPKGGINFGEMYGILKQFGLRDYAVPSTENAKILAKMLR